jgi:thioesterase domain-containing protein
LDAWEWHSRSQQKLSTQEKLQRYKARIAKIVLGPQRWGYLAERLRRRRSKIIYSVYAALNRQVPQSVGDIQDINAFAAANYRPKPYAGRLTLFRTLSPAGHGEDDHHFGWGALAAGGVEVHEIPGSHLDITSEPNVRTLAQKLGKCLENAQRELSGSSNDSNSKPTGIQ